MAKKITSKVANYAKSDFTKTDPKVTWSKLGIGAHSS